MNVTFINGGAHVPLNDIRLTALAHAVQTHGDHNVKAVLEAARAYEHYLTGDTKNES